MMVWRDCGLCYVVQTLGSLELNCVLFECRLKARKTACLFFKLGLESLCLCKA